MKKMIIAIALVALAFSVQADLLNGDFTGTAFHHYNDSSLQKVSGDFGVGWITGGGNALVTNVVGSGVVDFTETDTLTPWASCIAQAWTDTLTGNQQLKINFSAIDVASLTAPILRVELLEIDATATNAKFKNGFPLNDTSIISSMFLTDIDLTAISTGEWSSGVIDFTGKSGLYGVRLSFQATADAGANDNIQLTSVGVVPEPATALLLGVGGVGAWMLRRNLRKSKEEQEG